MRMSVELKSVRVVRANHAVGTQGKAGTGRFEWNIFILYSGFLNLFLICGNPPSMTEGIFPMDGPIVAANDFVIFDG